MTKLVARIKVLPSDAEINLDEVAANLKSTIPEGMNLKSYNKEPIAFGLYSLICDFVLEDAEGQMDKLEDFIKNTNGVSELQAISVSRQSVNLK
ncbi:MAG: elongation factor 1-beta [Nitrososphaeraceae archaeon]